MPRRWDGYLTFPYGCSSPRLQAVIHSCTNPSPQARPTFDAVIADLCVCLKGVLHRGMPPQQSWGGMQYPGGPGGSTPVPATVPVQGPAGAQGQRPPAPPLLAQHGQGLHGLGHGQAQRLPQGRHEGQPQQQQEGHGQHGQRGAQPPPAGGSQFQLMSGSAAEMWASVSPVDSPLDAHLQLDPEDIQQLQLMCSGEALDAGEAGPVQEGAQPLPQDCPSGVGVVAL